LAFFCYFSEFLATKQTKVKQKSQKQKDLAVPKWSKNDMILNFNWPFLRSKIISYHGCKKWSQRSPIFKILILWSDLRSSGAASAKGWIMPRTTTTTKQSLEPVELRSRLKICHLGLFDLNRPLAIEKLRLLHDFRAKMSW
jgi:hypothetical protein